jgi:hypothetical protein
LKKSRLSLIFTFPIKKSFFTAGTGAFMSYLNKTSCSASGPVIRKAANGNTWAKFTLKNVGRSAQGEELVEIATYYPPSSSKPR